MELTEENVIGREAFTPEELRLIGAAAQDKPFLYAIFVVGAHTGLREGDLATLRWAEIDLPNGIIERRMLKNGKLVRIPLLPGLRAYLDGFEPHGEYVLPEHAKMYQQNPTGISWRVRTFLEALGFETTRKVPGRSKAVSVKDVHALRHTFCWLAAANDIPMPVIKSIVRDMDEELTRQYAVRAAEKKLKKQPVIPVREKKPVENLQAKATSVLRARTELFTRQDHNDY